MKGLTHTLLLAVTVMTLLSRGLALDVFLANITIYTDHERDRPFFKNHPEVYLSCDDGRPRLELKHVNDEGRAYLFNPGEVLATTVDETGACVECHLKESDPSILKDDTFGDFPLCWHQFTQTGDYVAFVPGQFQMGLQCPDCLVVPEPEPEVLPPAPEPDAEVEGDLETEFVAAPPSIETVEKEDADEDDPIGTYYYFTSTTTPGRTFSVENGEDSVGLQSEDGDTGNEEGGGSSGGLSTATVLSLCFVFLVVGVGAGVLFFWKYSAKVANERAVASAFELTKIGVMKKGKL